MIVGVNKRNLKKLNFAEFARVKVGKLLPNFIALLQRKKTFMSKLPHICNFSNFQFVKVLESRAINIRSFLDKNELSIFTF